MMSARFTRYFPSRRHCSASASRAAISEARSRRLPWTMRYHSSRIPSTTAHHHASETPAAIVIGHQGHQAPCREATAWTMPSMIAAVPM